MYHPKFIRSPFYVGGDSYGGKIVPIVVQEISNGNEIELWPKINLKGYIVGNPLTTEDELLYRSRIKYGHRVSILSDDLYESSRIVCNEDNFIKPDANNTACLNALQAIVDASGPRNQFNLDNVLEPQCPDVKPSKTWCRKQTEVLMNVWTNHKIVREALQVREGTIHDNHWVRCNRSLPYTLDVQSSFSYHQNLSKNSIRALIYSGDQDMFIPYVGTVEWIQRLDIPIDVNWRPWFVDGQVTGYVTDYSNGHYHLTFTTIKGAGHIAVEYKYRECFAMIHKWLAFNYL